MLKGVACIRGNLRGAATPLFYYTKISMLFQLFVNQYFV
jgi:hypothetical protein